MALVKELAHNLYVQFSHSPVDNASFVSFGGDIDTYGDVDFDAPVGIPATKAFRMVLNEIAEYINTHDTRVFMEPARKELESLYQRASNKYGWTEVKGIVLEGESYSGYLLSN